jgi:hypothetical protein
MMKKISLCLLLVFLFIACKKEHKPATTVKYDVSGTWALTSYQTNFAGGLNVSAVQYPCLSNNITIFYNDSTALVNYTGNDTCYVTPVHTAGSHVIGFPGLAPINSTWKLRGNMLYITYPGNPKSIPGTLTSVNGKLTITFRDTVASGGNNYYINTVDVKQ